MGLNREAMEVRDASTGCELNAAETAVPVGYKQTEVGVIPKDWELKALGSLTNLLTNGFVGTATSAYVDGDDGVPYVQGYNVDENSFNFHGIKRVSRSFHAQHQKSCLKPEDLLTIQTGDIGVTAVVPSELEGANCHALIISRFDKQVSEPRFYAQYFNSEQGRVAFKKIETGTTMKHLNGGDMKRLLLPSPHIDEQRAIAKALSDVDALLEGLDRLIAKKRDLKQAAMQQLLTGQTRLPGFEGEWEVKPLEKIADIRSGGTPSTSNQEFWSGGVAWCTPTDITALHGRKYLTETERTISDKGLQASSAEVIPPYSIIMTTRATIGECAINTIPMTTNQGFKNLIPSTADSEFLYYLMTTQKQRLIKLCGGSTFLEVGKKQLRTFEVKLPLDIEEQTAIATALSDMDAELEALEQRRAKTAALKQAMMQELLTGRTRLV